VWTPEKGMKSGLRYYTRASRAWQFGISKQKKNVDRHACINPINPTLDMPDLTTGLDTRWVDV